MSQLTTAVSLKRHPTYGRVAIIPTAAYAVSSTPVISVTMKGSDWFDAFNLLLTVTTLSGSSNTVDVYIQGLAPDGSTWYDVGKMTQKTAVGTYFYSFRPAGAWDFTVTTGTATEGQTNTVNMPPQMRIYVTIGGTSTITFQVDMEFFKRGA